MPIAPKAIYKSITNTVSSGDKIAAITYITNVESEIGIAPMGIEIGDKTHKRAAKILIVVIRLIFILFLS